MGIIKNILPFNSNMWDNYRAVVIQNFYRRFVQCERDRNILCKVKIPVMRNGKSKRRNVEVGSPMDPIYREVYDEKYRFRLVEWPVDVKKANVWHFNILSLVEWLNTSKEWVNPMTNCLFLNRSIDRIVSFVNERNIRRRLKIKVRYNEKEVKKIKMNSNYVSNEINSNGQIYLNLLVDTIKNNDVDGNYNLLENNYDKIESDYFKINNDLNLEIYLEKTKEKVSPIGALHLAVFYGNCDIVHNLLYFGIDYDKKCGNNGYTALHLSAILNLSQIGKYLTMYGANMEETCVFQNEVCTVYDICDKMKNSDFVESMLE